MLSKQESRFVDDLEATQKLPKWVDVFRQKVLDESRLPFILIYNAVGVARNDKTKSAAIAISTSNLQRAQYLLEGTNSLSALGELRERALLKDLGKKNATAYVKAFSEI